MHSLSRSQHISLDAGKVYDILPLPQAASDIPVSKQVTYSGTLVLIPLIPPDHKTNYIIADSQNMEIDSF